MKFSKDDPRITAYALGEIDDPAERDRIEAALAADPELCAAVDEIRATAEILKTGLGSEPAPEPSEFEKARMEAPSPKPKSRFRRQLFGLAAALAFAAILIPQMLTYKRQTTPRPEPVSADEVAPRALTAPSDETGPEGSPLFEQDGDRVELASEADLRDRADGGAPLEDASEIGRSVDSFAPPAEEPASPDAIIVAPSTTILPSLDIAVEVDPAFGIGGGSAAMLPQVPKQGGFDTESYDPIEDTGFRSPLVAPLSTFSIDVDTASYANVRRFLEQGRMPPADAVRIEELINYFPYDDAPPTEAPDEGRDPFAVHLSQSFAPWKPEHRLLRIALKGYEMPWSERPASNLVFLLDVSGSMNGPNKLPLVKEAMDLLVRRLDGRDRVAIVVYAGGSGLVLPSTTANNAETIRHALENLQAGGSTNAGAGIELAYETAREHFIEGGNNRVILCSDGDFNVGRTNRGELAEIAEERAEQGISLTILGFGMGNYKDDMLETLSNRGKGSYAYIDSSAEARKVFLEDLASNIFKIAKDVKIQVEFNPAVVRAYRLIGYENRRLQAEDFNDDKKKAGDIGPGHSVVALYEIVPVGTEIDLPGVDPLRYQEQRPASAESDADAELATVKLRYKQPEGEASKLIARSVRADALAEFGKASADHRFTAAVAAFGMRLRESEALADFGYESIERIAVDALGGDPGGHRSAFTDLVRRAGELAK